MTEAGDTKPPRHTLTMGALASQEEVGFKDHTESVFDPTTRRVSTRALKELIAETVEGDAVTLPAPAEKRDSPAARILSELNERRTGTGELAERFGRYTLLGTVGKGGMAEVRLAAVRGADDLVKLCVVKRVARDRGDPAHLLSMFREEARVSAALAHPNVIELLDSGEVDGVPFLAFELIDGVSLRELCTVVSPLRVPLKGVLEIGRAAAAGLAHAHRLPGNVVHRDVTPQNLLVDRFGVVKLVDFGIAKFDGREHETKHGHVKGKLGYMAPEQSKGQELTARTDVFALGLVLTELIAGERVLPPAFMVLAESESLVRTRLGAAQYDVPRPLAELLVRMTAIEPDDRPEAEEVAKAMVAIESNVGGETLQTFAAREVFEKLEPFENGIVLPPEEELDEMSFDDAPTSYARTLRRIRAPSRTRTVPPPAPSAPAPHGAKPALLFLVAAILVGLGTAAFLLLQKS